MDAPQKQPQAEKVWLTREQIDAIVAELSADDLIESGLTDAGDDKGKVIKAARTAFNLAAESMGYSNGTPASKHVRLADLQYWTDAISGAVNVDSPKAEPTKG